MTLKTLNLIAGIALLIVTVIELFEEKASLEIELEHGLFIYAIAHVTSRLVELIEGYRKVREHRMQTQE